MQKEDFRGIVRINNTDIDGNKKLIDGIRKIKGVSFSFANAVCTIAGIDRYEKVGNLKDEELKQVEGVIASASTHFPQWMLNRRRSLEENVTTHLVTSDLTFAQENDIRQMKKIKSYRGLRHMIGAPVRGQRTRSNFRRNKGKVMGVAKSKPGKSGGK